VDDFGRCQFIAFWLDHNVGYGCDEFGVRGQVFLTDPEAFAERRRAGGRAVTVIYDDTTA
jgi:hypothetical protein